MIYVQVGARAALAVVFLLAFVSKLHSRPAYAAFRTSVAQLGALPSGLVGPAAAATVAAEVVLAALLAVPNRWAGLVGLLGSAALLVVYIGVIGRAISHGNRAPCRCFGSSAAPLGRRHLVRNLVLVAVAIVGAVAVAVGAAGTVAAAGALAAIACGCFVGLVASAVDELAGLLGPA